tara:strand:+ start:137 stop:580 length:444 start_codon:yes stop_codon:yes gene_type:complete
MAEKSNSMGADATLVSAAQKMGQALVPADTSKMFKEQFEALGKMHEAKASMITGAITSGLNALQTGIDKKKAKKAEWEADAAYYGSAEDRAKNTKKEKIESAVQEVRRRTAERKLREMNKEETIQGLGITGEINYTPSEVKSLNKYK